MKKHYSDNERRRIYDTVNTKISEGNSRAAATKALGIDIGTYANWHKKFQAPPTTSVVAAKKKPIVLAEQTESKMMCIFGTPEEICNVLKHMR